MDRETRRAAAGLELVKVAHGGAVMAARRLLLISAFSLAVGVSLPLSVSRAEDLSSPSDVENAKNKFIGVVNANDVLVRSQPHEDSNPTMRLDKGAHVTVIGLKNSTWLKILPPEGSF